MATLDELQARREELAQQRDSGVASVSYKGRTVTYRGQAEIDRAIAAIDKDIAKAEGRKPLRRLLVVSEKGL